MKTISFDKRVEHLSDAIASFRSAKSAMALTGAGISVNSGIADFRSPGGVWTVFYPEEYATLEVFLHNPEKAWQLYRELGKTLVGKKPNKGHRALAELEKDGFLTGIITQNVDNLHQTAGSKNVLEIHGDHLHLQCLQCNNLIEVTQEHYNSSDIPLCIGCSYPLKPNVVLFGEAVRSIEKIHKTISSCDLLLVIGTSAQVHPAAALPGQVKQHGGLVYEFNLESSLTDHNSYANNPLADYFFEGDLSMSLPKFKDSVLAG